MEGQVQYMNTYILFHKPSGCVTARHDQIHKTVMDYFPYNMREKLHPVGRLDKDTEGLLLITDDGKWNQILMSPETKVTKEYFFVALGQLSEDWIRKLTQGILLSGEKKVTGHAKINVKEISTLATLSNEFRERLDKKILKNPPETSVTLGNIIISEGKKHQVKRMLKAAGCYVIYLKRTAIGNLFLEESLKTGMWRYLTDDEKYLMGLLAKNAQKSDDQKKTDDLQFSSESE